MPPWGITGHLWPQNNFKLLRDGWKDELHTQRGYCGLVMTWFLGSIAWDTLDHCGHSDPILYFPCFLVLGILSERIRVTCTDYSVENRQRFHLFRGKHILKGWEWIIVLIYILGRLYITSKVSRTDNFWRVFRVQVTDAFKSTFQKLVIVHPCPLSRSLLDRD